MSSVFSHLSINVGEDYLKHDDEYKELTVIPKAFFKTLDFSMAKDGYRFSKIDGNLFYTFGIIYLNIVILNLVIAIVGEVYDEVMQVKKETELKMKAKMLKDLYEFRTMFSCLCCLHNKGKLGNLYVLRKVPDEDADDTLGRVNKITNANKRAVETA